MEVSRKQSDRIEFRDYSELLNTVVMMGACMYMLNHAHNMYLDMQDGASASQLDALKKKLAEKLDRPDILDMTFDSSEAAIMKDVVCPGDMNVGFADLGGMDSELSTIVENICVPIELSQQYENFQDAATIPTGTPSNPTRTP